MAEFLEGLQKLNKFETKIPEEDISKVISDPKEYAIKFAEQAFVENIPKIMKAFRLGDKLGKELSGKSNDNI